LKGSAALYELIDYGQVRELVVRSNANGEPINHAARGGGVADFILIVVAIANSAKPLCLRDISTPSADSTTTRGGTRAPISPATPLAVLGEVEGFVQAVLLLPMESRGNTTSVFAENAFVVRDTNVVQQGLHVVEGAGWVANPRLTDLTNSVAAGLAKTGASNTVFGTGKSTAKRLDGFDAFDLTRSKLRRAPEAVVRQGTNGNILAPIDGVVGQVAAVRSSNNGAVDRILIIVQFVARNALVTSVIEPQLAILGVVGLVEDERRARIKILVPVEHALLRAVDRAKRVDIDRLAPCATVILGATNGRNGVINNGARLILSVDAPIAGASEDSVGTTRATRAATDRLTALISVVG